MVLHSFDFMQCFKATKQTRVLGHSFPFQETFTRIIFPPGSAASAAGSGAVKHSQRAFRVSFRSGSSNQGLIVFLRYNVSYESHTEDPFLAFNEQILYI